MSDFEGKVALITGGASGIGKVTAKAFATQGARVVIVDVDQATSNETCDEIEQAGGDASCFQVDVSQSGEVEQLIDDVIGRFGRLDCCFNNAADNAAHLEAIGPLHEYPEENWDRVLGVNLKGVWLCTKFQVRYMLSSGGGAIVNMASALGLTGSPNMVGYVASKHGVVGLTRAAALEYAQNNIRINAVCPGYINTPMIRARMNEPESKARLLAREPIGRVGEPEEVAAAVIWLCSKAASFVTGTAMSVDGGWLAQ